MVVTPNIGIFIPTAGQTNYDQSFSAGMVNIDQHDHSGAPNKGLPIATSGIADGSVTYNKLNANVVDTTTGLGVSVTLPNQLQTTGLLKSIYQNATASGFLAKNGTVASARTFQGTAGQIAITNPAGIAADPTFSLAPIVSKTTQPAFLATADLQSDQTGDGTAYVVIFNAVDARNFDQGTNFDGTSTFTVPSSGAGIYLIDVDLSLGDLGAGHTLGFVDIYINSVQTFRGFNCNLGAIRNSGNGAQFPFSQIMKLAVADAVTVVVTVSNSTKTVDVLAGSTFSAIKIW